MARPIKTPPDAFVIDASGTENEYDPSITALANGRILFGFTNEPTVGDPNAMEAVHQLVGGGAVSLNLANAAGADEQHVSVSGFQSGAMVAAAWAEKNDATGEFDIYARVTTAGTGLNAGADILPRFLVNAGASSGVQDRPEVAAVGDDRFAVAWIDRSTSKVNYAVYDISGHAVFSPAAFSVSNATQPFGTPTARIDIVALDEGRFIVSYRADGTFEAKFRIGYASPSVPFATGEIDVDGTSDGNGKSGLAVLSDGRFVIVYQAFDAIHGRIFNPDGTASTPVFTVSPIVSAFSLPQVTALQDGRFMAVMGDGDNIIAQVMHPNGTPDGDPFVVNDVTTGAQTRPVIATLADGRIVVGWETTEKGNLDIKYAVYDPRETGVVIAGTGTNDDFLGSRFDDTLSGGNAGDRLSGGDGNDTIYGGSGNDSIEGGNGNDVLNGGTGADFMQGGVGDDWYYIDDFGDVINQELPGQGAADRVLTRIDYVLDSVLNIETISTDDNFGTAPLSLTGNFNPNTILGNAGNNILRGGGGGDVLVGFAGNDALEGGAGNDFLDGGSDADTAMFSAAIGSYNIVRLSSGVVRVADTRPGNPNGFDDITNVEQFQFTGSTKSLAQVLDITDFNIFWHQTSTNNWRDWTMSFGAVSANLDIGGAPVEWDLKATGDFNADGIGDALWFNTSTGEVRSWLLSPSGIAANIMIGMLPGGWSPIGTGDFNGDGASDVILENFNTGELRNWTMQNGAVGGNTVLGGLPAEWRLIATGDFNGDGTYDIFWRNTSTNEIREWTMLNGAISANTIVAAPPLSFGTAATGDFNHDNTADIIWRDVATGDTRVFLMANGAVANSFVLPSPPPEWKLIAAGDYDQNGHDDLLWQNSSTGQVREWLLNNGAIINNIILGTTPTDFTTAVNAATHTDFLPSI